MISGSFSINTKAGKARRNMLIVGTKCMAGFSDLHAPSNVDRRRESHLQDGDIHICTAPSSSPMLR